MRDIISYLQKELLFNSIELLANRYQEFYQKNYLSFENYKTSVTNLMKNYNIEDVLNNRELEKSFDEVLEGMNQMQWSIFNTFSLQDFDDLKESLLSIADPHLKDVLDYIDKAKQEVKEKRGLKD